MDGGRHGGESLAVGGQYSKEGESIRPIGLPVVEYLERRRTNDVGTYVFPGQGEDNAFGSFPNHWKHLFEDSPLSDVTPHVLRHSFASIANRSRSSRVDYGYMWWPVPAADGSLGDGAFSARGIFGQFIYVDPKRRIISVVLSARPKPTGSATVLDNDFWHAMLDALR